MSQERKEQQFWIDRWKNNEIKCHKPEFNKLLVDYADHLGSLQGHLVFVPLCGKSLDMLWFVQQGAKVVGVELSAKAAEDFFVENKLPFTVANIGEFQCFMGEDVTIWCGDLFAITADMIGTADIVYDRAALVALNPKLRAEYIAKLKELLSPTGKIYLISAENDLQDDIAPYSINADDIKSLYTDFASTTLHHEQQQDMPPHLVERGMQKYINDVFLLQRK